MSNAPEVGGQVTLPSGLVVLITVAADPDRPWSAVPLGHRWQVGRLHLNDGSSRLSLYHAGKRMPLQLDQVDARTLAEILNRSQAATFVP